jgi:ubiquinone/menaquinone biosynthesis C-methylase UbiE
MRGGLSKYTRKAYHVLPQWDKPCILDVGCGSGVPTMELARLSKGQITALDTDQSLLDRLEAKIKQAGLSQRVKTVNGSLLDMGFPDDSFDIIWSEGSIWIIGFERGLREWGRFLRPKGFLVVHDEVGNITEKLELVSSCGYDLLDYFILGEDIWRTEYFAPLEKMINEIKTKYADDPQTLAALDPDQREIDMFKKDPKRCESVFFILRKR